MRNMYAGGWKQLHILTDTETGHIIKQKKLGSNMVKEIGLRTYDMSKESSLPAPPLLYHHQRLLSITSRASRTHISMLEIS